MAGLEGEVRTSQYEHHGFYYNHGTSGNSARVGEQCSEDILIHQRQIRMSGCEL